MTASGQIVRPMPRRYFARRTMMLVLLTLAAAAAGQATPARAQLPDAAQPPRPLDLQPSVLFLANWQGYVEPGLARELTAQGFIVDSRAWAGLNVTELRRYNTLVIVSYGTPHDPCRPEYAEVLDEYLRLGGGIVSFVASGEQLALDALPWLDKHGLRLRHEYLRDPQNARPVPRPQFVYGQPFILTTNVREHPVTRGVASLWYPSQPSGYGLPNAMPLDLDANWTPLLLSEPTATVQPWESKLVDPANLRPELLGKAGEWPIVAERRIGNGRMVVIGLLPKYYVEFPHFHGLDLVQYSRGIDGIPSHFNVLFENALRWTAEPTLGGGQLGWHAGLFPPTDVGDTPPVDWSTKTFPEPGAWLRGHAGARTELSGGEGTVADWVEAAKEEGLSFLVFLEDMSAMTPAKWRTLQEQCKAASSGGFRAYPGMIYRMRIATGGVNHRFVVDGPGLRSFPPDRFLNADNEIVIEQGNDQAPYFMDINQGNTGIGTTVGFARHADNATPWWDYKLYGIFSIFTRDEGDAVDDAVAEYLALAAAHATPNPIAIELLESPEELRGVIADGRPHLVVNGAADPRYPEMGGGLAQVNLHVGTGGEKWNPGYGDYRGWFGPTVTEGPMATLRFRSGYAWKRVEYPRYWIDRYMAVEHEDWFMPSWARLPVRLDVASDRPLRSIVIHDGSDVFMRFDPRGATEFSTEFWLPHDQNRHLIAYVEDELGRRAITPEIWTAQTQLQYTFCGDRINAPVGRGSEPGHGNAYEEGVLKMAAQATSVAAAYPKPL